MEPDTAIISPESYRVFEDEGPYTIADYYPVFDQRAPKSKSRRWFRVQRIINERRDEDTRAIVSTSLYFGTNVPDKFGHRPALITQDLAAYKVAGLNARVPS